MGPFHRPACSKKRCLTFQHKEDLPEKIKLMDKDFLSVSHAIPASELPAQSREAEALVDSPQTDLSQTIEFSCEHDSFSKSKHNPNAAQGRFKLNVAAYFAPRTLPPNYGCEKAREKMQELAAYLDNSIQLHLQGKADDKELDTLFNQWLDLANAQSPGDVQNMLENLFGTISPTQVAELRMILRKSEKYIECLTSLSAKLYGVGLNYLEAKNKLPRQEATVPRADTSCAP